MLGVNYHVNFRHDRLRSKGDVHHVSDFSKNNSHDKISSFSVSQETILTHQKLEPFLESMNRPAYSVWTYYELYQDLSQDQKSHRLKLLQTVQSHLGWDALAVTYWPVFSPIHQDSLSRRHFFISFMNRINPVYIFCFGAKAFHVLFPDKRFHYGKWMIDQLSLIVLPDIESLLPDNRILKNFVWNVLKKYTPDNY